MPMPTIPEPETIAGSRAHLFGVSAAMVTPFASDGSVDLPRLVAHAAHVMRAGADGMTLFGTTGEGASLGMSERVAMLDAVLESGIAAHCMTAGIAASDLEGAVWQAQIAMDRGVNRLLLAPPFYFKGIDDDALFRWVAGFVARLDREDARIILYHIPQVTGVHFDAPLIRRIKDGFGNAILGVKDSAGDWEHIAGLLPMEDLAILVGDERMLARAAPLGGAGAISGMANLMPAQIGRLVRQGIANPALNALVDDIVKVPVTPLVKALVGAVAGDAGWSRARPPLSDAAPEIVGRLAPRVVSLL
ncbi:dihydrodipicolinate synthase family protein [Tropicimonas sp.]|uniref:dihydrodipicolinate synthase family protein n=1 Tax=Tropicimonas sp. TaxID=2067044 RepID=UPI003A842989